MGTIVERKRQDGSSGFTAQVRIKRDGKVYTEAKTFNKRKLAENWLAMRENELEKGLPTPRLVVTFRELIEAEVADQSKELSRIRALHHLLNDPIANLNVTELTVPALLDFVKQRLNEVTPSTVRFDLATLRTLLTSAQSEQGIAVALTEFDAALDYAKRKGWAQTSQRRHRRLLQNEESTLIEYAAHTYQGTIPMHDIIPFAIYSTRRLDEIMQLRWADLNREQKTILVRDLKHPTLKQGNHQKARLTNEALAIIERQPTADERIFPYKSKSVGKMFYQMTRLLGILDLHFHDLRHEGISRLFERGYAVHEVALFSLHRDWHTLQRYTHLKPEDVPDR